VLTSINAPSLRRGECRSANVLLVVAFVGFYGLLEYLTLSSRSVFNFSYGTDVILLAVLSILNIVPAGFFAFGVVSVFPFKKKAFRPAKVVRKPKVAVVYTTCNDFVQDAAKYNSTEAFKLGYKFFILDDSTDPRYLSFVDSFVTQCHHSGLENVVLARRNHRRGFKGGALNDWILNFGDQFDYFFMLDADSLAGSDALRKCVEIASTDSSICLVQSKNLAMTKNPTRLTQSTVVIQHAYTEVIQAAMTKLGCSPFYGHNALVKVSAVKEVGGFTEETSEDFKTIAKMIGRGYRSEYAEDAITYEEVPPDYFSEKKRLLRWAKDAAEQISLLRYKLPVALSVYILYGWASYLANLALVTLVYLTSWKGALPTLVTDPHLTMLTGILSGATVTLWPFISIRAKDKELTPKNVLKAVFWGSFYHAPLAAPISFVIIRTALKKPWNFLATRLKHTRAKSGAEEFVITPKSSFIQPTDFLTVLSNLRLEIGFAIGQVAIAIVSGLSWYIPISSVQTLVLLLLPVAIVFERRPAHIPVPMPHFKQTIPISRINQLYSYPNYRVLMPAR
jgi:cellulose synthase/poly-beta-1,6-N-acetylglucosamine synthase-like glycosyltransferase